MKQGEKFTNLLQAEGMEAISCLFFSSTMKDGGNIMAFTHFNEDGRAKMVDISAKSETERTARAESALRMQPDTLKAILEGRISKGDVLAVAQVAGIMACKRTADIVPMCHPLPLTGVDIRFSNNGTDILHIEAEVRTKGRTGVEMEALMAVSAAALTVYDMCKALEKGIVIEHTQLLFKSGGIHGEYHRET